MKKCFVFLAAAVMGILSVQAASPVEVASFAVEGKGKVTSPASGVYRMDAISGENPAGKSAQYCRMVLYFKNPVDLRNRTLSFKAASETPEKILAFYVRAFGSNPKKPDASFNKYSAFFKNQDPMQFQIRAQKNLPPLSWEPAVVTGQAPDAVTKLQILVGTRSANSPIQLTLSDLQLSDAAAPTGNGLEIASVQMMNKGEITELNPGEYQMNAVSGPNPPGKSAQYCRFVVKFKKPLDLKNNRLQFQAISKTGDRIVALYVRGFGSDPKKPDVSFYKYQTIFKNLKKPLLISLQEGNGRVLAWEPAAVTGKPAEAVTQLQFLVGTRSANSPIELTVSDFKLINVNLPARANAADAVPEFFKEANLSVTNASVAVKKKDKSLQLVSPGNTRVSLDINLPFTVDMTGKQFAFTIKTADPVDVRSITSQLIQDGDAKPAWLHVAWGAPLEVTPGGKFVVYENSALGTLKSECRKESGKPAKKVSIFRFDFDLALPGNAPIQLDISDIRIEPQAPTGLKATDNWSPVPVYAKTPARVKHPVGPMREEAIARARENVKRHAWAKKQLELFRTGGKHWLDMEKSQIAHWIPKEDAFFKCVCPNCRTATEFAWAGMSAISKDGNTLICQKCKMTFPNEKYPENHTYTVERPDGSLKTLRCYLGPDQITGGENMGPRHHITGALNYVKIRYLAFIRNVALLYTLDPKKEYAERVRDVLLRAAEVYPGYSIKFRSTVYKNPRDGHYMAGKFHSWKFSDGGLISGLMLAYTLTYNSGVYSDADKVAIENGLAREYLWMMTAYPPSADYCSNAVPAHYNAAAMCAAVLGDHDAMQWVLQSLPEFLRTYYRRDGFWHEVTPSYANMANVPLNLLAATLHGYSDAADYKGDDRYDNINVITMLPQLIQVLQCMSPGILPTGGLPAVNDSAYNTRQAVTQLDMLALLNPTEHNKRMAAYVAHRYPTTWERDSLFFRAPDADPQESRPELLNRSWIVPAGGWAILRRPESAEMSATVLSYSAFSSSHMHHGTLGFILCEDGKEVVSDLGYQSCWHPEYRWITSPLAHNLVIVDGAAQGNGRYGEVELFAGHTDTLAVRVAGYRTAAPAVRRQARTMLDLPLPGARKYVVDFVETVGGKDHMYVFHADGPDFSAGDISLAPDKASRIGGNVLGANFMMNIRSANLPQGTHRFAWTYDRENVTTGHLALAQDGLLIVGEGPGARAHSLEKKPLHVLTMRQAGPESLFAMVLECTAPGKEAIQKVERKDSADCTGLIVTHRHGRDEITLFRNGDMTVARYDVSGKLASVWIAGERELAGVKGLPEYCGKILQVSKDGRTLFTDLTSLPAGYDLTGKIISIDGLGDGAYRIASAVMKDGKAVIRLDPEEIPRNVTAGRAFRFRPVVEKIILPRL